MGEQQTSFKPTLGLFDATMLVAGSMIGSGIFIVSADITRNVGSAGWLIIIWLITGFMTMAAAVSYGELSSMFPKAGGQYTYLKESYNPLTGFLYGWSFFAVIQTGTIAAVGVAFSKFTAYLIPSFGEDNILFTTGSIKISAAQLLAIATIILLTWINSRGIKNGRFIQTTLTIIKILSLAGLTICGFLFAKGDAWNLNWGSDSSWQLFQLGTDGSVSEYVLLGALGAIAAAMVGSIFSSVAWENVTYIAGEVKNPKRNIGLGLFLGTLLVTIIYVLTNLMYTAVLPMQEIATAEKDRVAVAASHVIFGNTGTVVIAVMIMISTFGCNNGLILSGARVYYTMAQDGLFFKKTGTLNRFSVPEFGLWIQCVAASLLCLSGKYGDLLDMVSFVVVLFYVLTIIGIFILRKKKPELERPYKAFAYPVVPALFVLMGVLFCFFLVRMKPVYALIGLGIVLLGIPLYYLAIGGSKKNRTH